MIKSTSSIPRAAPLGQERRTGKRLGFASHVVEATVRTALASLIDHDSWGTVVHDNFIDERGKGIVVHDHLSTPVAATQKALDSMVAR